MNITHDQLIAEFKRQINLCSGIKKSEMIKMVNELHPDLAEETTELNCDGAWDTLSVIAKLVEAADILLHKKDYDGHGWEEMEICYKIGLEILKTSAPPAGGEL